MTWRPLPASVFQNRLAGDRILAFRDGSQADLAEDTLWAWLALAVRCGLAVRVDPSAGPQDLREAGMRFLTFQPLIPPALWVLVALACAASWAWYGLTPARRREPAALAAILAPDRRRDRGDPRHPAQPDLARARPAAGRQSRLERAR